MSTVLCAEMKPKKSQGWVGGNSPISGANIISQISEIGVHFWLPMHRLRSTFAYLANEWKRDTLSLSSPAQISVHYAYQRIIGMGWDAVPLILMDLRRQPDHWFWALRSITGEDPVLPEHRGRIQDMANDWINWGNRNGFI